ncbi:putative S-layer protein [Pleurocapsa sp. PCC 7327]|uniref:iron uptake porin n=1 Tax=Pleurocapsa sp. PCC 7327 TaxID=118163 RepID=UPI00029FE26D|nr:iron uptake porin [Pleurocapsa sp. PCC 7327]AFY79091.1 putative S-layer protein [Pleurocapsa sp. PCC 7327]
MRGKLFLLGSLLWLLLPSVVRAEPFQEINLEAIASNFEKNKLSAPRLRSTNWSQFSDINLNSFDAQLSAENLENRALPRVAQLKTDNPIVPATTEIEAESLAQFNDESLAIDIFSDDIVEQVTNVSQLRDVQPTEWAYEALRSLVERYGCIAGYPDGTFRGNRAMSRYEFAAGLNACINTMERLIQENVSILREDLEVLKRLGKEFETELAALGGRMDNLEGRVAFLEDHQFSTTVTMNGEVIFGLATVFGGDPPGGCLVLPDDTGFFFGAVDATGDVNTNDEVDCTDRNEPDRNTVLAYLARIGLQASFTGKDRLRMFLTTGNFDDGGFTQPESLNTYMARLGYQAGLNNNVFLDILEYRFPIFDDRVVISAIPYGFNLSSVLSANSPYFDIGRGAISRFGQLNPILRIGGPMETGVGIDWLIAEPVRLQVAYGSRNSSDPEGGFVGADHSALGVQVLVQPFETVAAGITYVNAYSGDGTLGTFTGSVNAETGGLWAGSSIPDSILGNPNNPQVGAESGFGACCGNFIGDFPAQINAVGGSLQWRITENLIFGAWGGYIFTNFLKSLPNDPVLGDSAGQKPFANAATFAVSLGLSDPFGREGDLLSFIFGMPPKLVDAGPETQGTPVPFFEQVVRDEDPTTVTDNNPNLNTVGERNLNALPKKVGQEDEATSLHFEVFYRFKINDNIWITPGVFMVTNPGHIDSNDTIFVGTIRTTFRF